MIKTGNHDAFGEVWAHEPSRRTVLRATLLGVGLVSAGGLTGACTSSTGPAGSTDSLTVGMSFDFTAGMDPVKTSSLGALTLNGLVFEKLYRTDPFPPRTVVPELAVGEPREITPTRYRIQLRDGVKFHDGKPLTADDVVFTVQRVQDAAVGSLYARFFKLITKVEAVGPAEVEFTLSAPTTLLAERLSLVGIMSRAAVTAASPADLELRPVGSGPFQVVQAVSQQGVTLRKYADYSGNREVNYNTLTMTLMQDGNSRVTSLRTGQSQVIESLPFKDYAEFSRADGFSAGSVAPGDAITAILIHCGKPPFNDKRVRQALMYALDRDTITRTSFFGQAVPAWDGVLPSSNTDFSPGPFSYRYDPGRAKQLLAEAGLGGSPVAIDFLVLNTDDAVASQASIIEQNLRDVGFAPNMTPGGAGLYSRVSAGDYNAMIQAGGPATISPNAEFNLRWLYYGAVAEQFLFWTDSAAKQVADLLDRAQSAPDDATRKQLLADVQHIIQEEVPAAPVHFVNGVSAWSSRLQGYRPAPSGLVALDGVKG